MKKSSLTRIVSTTAFVFCFFTGVVFASDTEWTSNGNDVYKATSDGTVGIGVTTPAAKLHIQGTTSGNLLQIDTEATGDGPALIIAENGDVGIGGGPFGKFGVFGDLNDFVSAILFNASSGAEAVSLVAAMNNQNEVGLFGVASSGYTGEIFYGVNMSRFASKTFLSGYNSAGVAISAGINATSAIEFDTGGLSNTTSEMVIASNGNVGIGTTDPGTYKLAVKGKIRAEEVVVETGWADYVFEEGYKLPSLEKVESYIKENKRLPDVPSAETIREEGLAMSDMMTKQMQKIEELTLYLIEMKKENENIRKTNDDLKQRIAALESAK